MQEHRLANVDCSVHITVDCLRVFSVIQQQLCFNTINYLYALTEHFDRQAALLGAVNDKAS